MAYETVEIPFKTIGNRRCLTSQQLADLPYIAEFIGAFPHSFEYDPRHDIYVFIEPETSVAADKEQR